MRLAVSGADMFRDVLMPFIVMGRPVF